MNPYDTRRIEPEWQNIFVTNHAIEQYQSRVVDPTGLVSRRNNVVRRLKYVLLEGRRSDKDPSLKTELEPWLTRVSWSHGGRPVSVWMDKKRLCCLVVRDGVRHDQLVILTCFRATIKEDQASR